MKALITGGAGFIGSHLVDKLLARGYQVKVIDNLSTGRIENITHVLNKIQFTKTDLKNIEDTLKALKDTDVIFHFAANPEVRVSTVSPEVHFNENVVATFNLLEAMRRMDVREIVFASSSSVYGEPEEIPVSEDAPTRPVSVYGASKAACENLIHAYSRLYGMKAVILRYANVVGLRLRHGVIYDLIMKLRKDPTRLEVLGDGTQVRSYIHVDDAVEATLIAHERTGGGYHVFNVASEDWITVDEVVNIITEELGAKPEIIHKPILHGVGWPGDVKRIALRIDRLRELGFKPRMNSKEAVRVTVKALIRESG
ncbi:NAD-dependent epimerase/dehydratase family protein [Caldivirga maquilingensis]|uniref:NAD-dependent epimerase/dehydratase n=1 Tax=Caldivirga maquilingensis (strain ATCC 700844 / DSM 13496 / JCM 10307 / IC-167) TaxID=397948 RepID=A8M952_CALMQ|nr:NAD-dependent epimerase/dehydratase family protein [Caldivirga maquilingensis]ABW02271.1 NAD-dependent epimerase/dehydratase [Caldivirga maquilingensis IC-167]